MNRYQEKQIEQIKELRRKNHYSFMELQRITGIPATTIRNWCSNEIVGTRWDTLVIYNEKKRQEFKHSEDKIINDFLEINPAMAKLLAALIYWCEGAKYPSACKIAFTNSDTQLMRLFITLLRKAFTIDEAKFRVILQLHTTHDIKKSYEYWSNTLRIPINQFTKPTITSPNGKKHRKEYLGTCTLKYYDYKIQLKLTGIYEAFANKFAT